MAVCESITAKAKAGRGLVVQRQIVADVKTVSESNLRYFNL